VVLLAGVVLAAEAVTRPAVTLGAWLVALGLTSPAHALNPPQWKNCTAVNKRYPHGVGKVGAHDKTSGVPVTNFSAARSCIGSRWASMRGSIATMTASLARSSRRALHKRIQKRRQWCWRDRELRARRGNPKRNVAQHRAGPVS
jgi:hypothetical protein